MKAELSPCDLTKIILHINCNSSRGEYFSSARFFSCQITISKMFDQKFPLFYSRIKLLLYGICCILWMPHVSYLFLLLRRKLPLFGCLKAHVKSLPNCSVHSSHSFMASRPLLPVLLEHSMIRSI